jgi:hypothetical protein
VANSAEYAPVGLEDENLGLYLVTARHCVERAHRKYGQLWVRVNKRDSGSEMIEVNSPWYYPDSEADDVAVSEFPLNLSERGFDIAWWDLLQVTVNEQIIEREGIGIGDEVVAVGLFTQGRKASEPPYPSKWDHLSYARRAAAR